MKNNLKEINFIRLGKLFLCTKKWRLQKKKNVTITVRVNCNYIQQYEVYLYIFKSLRIICEDI